MQTLFVLASVLLDFVSAKTVEYNWNITWVYAAPDGFTRPVIGINGAWPLPTLEAEVGDRVIVNMDNQLGNRSVSLHYHGLFMNGTTQMDGPSQVNQCRAGTSGQFVYDFEITQPGTYWYHAHVDAQYPDGLRGPLIIHDPSSPYIDAYNASNEVVLTLSDWYHDFAANLRNSYISLDDPTGAEPIPDNALMNDAQNVDFDVLPGQTYFFRIVNIGAFASQYFWIEDHNMTIIEVDGVYTEAQEVEMIYVTPAQRYGVLITMKNGTSTNYPIVASMDTSLFDTLPPTLDYNVTGWLVYDTLAARPAPVILEEFYPYDDFELVPYDKLEMYENVDQNIELTFEFNNLDNGANYAFFNNVTYVPPLVPTLYTALSTGQDALNPAVYGSNTNAFVLGKSKVIQIVLNSLDTGKHPFHLHGHNFQVVARGEENAGVWNYTKSDLNIQHPMRRDTFRVEPGSYIVLRFVSDNPDKSHLKPF